MLIASDGDIRKAFGLTDDEIGEIIGRSRQAVNTGLKDGREYFKRPQWILIALALHERDPNALPQLFDYLASKNIELGNLPLGNSFSEINTIDIETLDARLVEVVVSDFFHFSTQHKLSCRKLIDLAVQGNAAFIFYHATDADRAHIETMVRDQAKLMETQEPENIGFKFFRNANQYPFIFSFLSRNSTDREHFTCLQDHYVQPDQFIYARFYNHLLSHDVVNNENSDGNLQRTVSS